MLGLYPPIAMHHLAVEPDQRSVKQAPKYMHSNLAAHTEAKVDRIISVGFIRQVYLASQYCHTLKEEWLALVEPNQLSMKQAPRHMPPDLVAKVEAEVDKVISTGFIR